MNARSSLKAASNGPRELTLEEQAAIAALRRLAKRWPKTLLLFSAGGSLCVMDAEAPLLPSGGLDPDAMFGDSIAIPNTGGDW